MPASRHTVFRSFPSGPELQAAQAQMDRGWPHMRPNSVLVAAMGNHWKAPGSWNKVIDMVDYTTSKGVYCAFQEVQDRCFNPYDALGTMRNEAALTALSEGFQYICYIDNDILPEPDHLYRLLQWGQPICAPYIVEPGTGTKLFGPNTLMPNTGLQRAKWSVLSMVLFQSSIFKAIGPEFWRDAVGADEGYHFMKAHYYGIYLWIDTSVQLQVSHRPLFPLALNRLSSGAMRDVEIEAKSVATAFASILARRNLPLLDADQKEIADALIKFMRIAKGEREILLQQRIERFIETPDRRPIDLNSPWIKDGEYMPFLVKAELAAKASANGQQPVATDSIGTGSANIANALAFKGVGNG